MKFFYILNNEKELEFEIRCYKCGKLISLDNPETNKLEHPACFTSENILLTVITLHNENKRT